MNQLLLLCILLIIIHQVLCYKFISNNNNNNNRLIKRNSLSSMNKNIAASMIGLILPLITIQQPSYAYGPQDVDLKIIGYKQVELCDGKKPIKK